jgi:hypothetical protein
MKIPKEEFIERVDKFASSQIALSIHDLPFFYNFEAYNKDNYEDETDLQETIYWCVNDFCEDTGYDWDRIERAGGTNI